MELLPALPLPGDKDDDPEEAVEESYKKEYAWREDRIGEDPETIYIRKETREEALAAMTDKQRQAFFLYYEEGYRQREIAEMLGIGQRSVSDRLNGALKQAKKYW